MIRQSTDNEQEMQNRERMWHTGDGIVVEEWSGENTPMWSRLGVERMQEKEADCIHKVHRDYKNVEQRRNGCGC
jgi:hypothetical protein